jgi:hypothetical protein
MLDLYDAQCLIVQEQLFPLLQTARVNESTSTRESPRVEYVPARWRLPADPSQARQLLTRYGQEACLMSANCGTLYKREGEL